MTFAVVLAAAGLWAPCGGSIAEAQDAPGAAFAEQRGGAVGMAAKAILVRKGTLRINIKLDVSRVLPNGTIIRFIPTTLVEDPTYRNYSEQGGQAQVAAGKVSKSFVIPYSWTVSSASAKVTVSVAVSGSATKNSLDYSDATRFERVIPLPAGNVTTMVNFQGAI